MELVLLLIIYIFLLSFGFIVFVCKFLLGYLRHQTLKNKIIENTKNNYQIYQYHGQVAALGIFSKWLLRNLGGIWYGAIF